MTETAVIFLYLAVVLYIGIFAFRKTPCSHSIALYIQMGVV